MADGFKFLRLDATDERDALRILEEVEPFVTEAAAHFVGGLQRKLAFLLPCEPNGFEKRGILELAAGGAADPHLRRGGDELRQMILDKMFLHFVAGGERFWFGIEETFV